MFTKVYQIILHYIKLYYIIPFHILLYIILYYGILYCIYSICGWIDTYGKMELRDEQGFILSVLVLRENPVSQS